MRFPNQFRRGFVSALFLLSMPIAGVSGVVQLSPAAYDVNSSTGSCDGFNCSTSYSKGFNAQQPASLSVHCTADLASPICSAATVSEGPFISVFATTQTNHVSQDASASGNIDYTYQILCDLCAAGTIVPMSVGGSAGMTYIPGSVDGTVTATISGAVDVAGYDPLTGTDNVVVDNTTISLPNGGVCEITWTGFNICDGPSGQFGTSFEAKVGTVYLITMEASVFVRLDNQVIFPGAVPAQAQASEDPVLSFAPGFDSTGYSIEVSPGVGNAAPSAPEPATWELLAAAGLAWACKRRLRRRPASAGKM